MDEDDSEDEQRFSVAHELAHFLRDYWLPRRTAVERLGPAALDVLDGRRPPTLAERLNGLLRNVTLGFHIHLLSRGEGGMMPAIAAAERDADRLAYELLAPADAVAAVTADRATAERVIREIFGLPPAHSAAYAAEVFPRPQPEDPLLERLFR